MGQKDYQIILLFILSTVILLVFIGGFVIFIIQYRKRKLVHDKEKAILNEQHLQEILTTKLEIQDQTMQDIGREIHDNVGQKLTLASIYANKMTYENKFPEQLDQIAAIGAILTESIEELRKLSRSLTSANAEISELKVLIENECKRVNDLNICKLEYRFNDTDYSISNTVKNFILRIIQEFIQNSLKHAVCKNISLNFDHREDGLTVAIQDDGVGFQAQSEAARASKGIGLTNMKKRADLIGAGFTLTSVLNQGTKLVLFIPDNKLNEQ